MGSKTGASIGSGSLGKKKQIHGGDLALVPLVILTKNRNLKRKQKNTDIQKIVINKRKKILQKCREFLDCGVAWRQCKTQSSFSDKILMNLKNKLKFKETSMITMKITCGMFLIQNSLWDRLKTWTTSIFQMK